MTNGKVFDSIRLLKTLKNDAKRHSCHLLFSKIFSLVCNFSWFSDWHDGQKTVSIIKRYLNSRSSLISKWCPHEHVWSRRHSWTVIYRTTFTRWLVISETWEMETTLKLRANCRRRWCPSIWSFSSFWKAIPRQYSVDKTTEMAFWSVFHCQFTAA